MMERLEKLPSWFLSVVSGLLFFVSWPMSPFPFLIFLAFVPLFILEKRFRESEIKVRGRFFLHCLLSFFIWNVSTTWWVCLSTLVGGIIAVIGNSLLMCVPMLLFHASQKRFSSFGAFIALPTFWLAFEYLHLNWELSWPWLTLGNVFAEWPDLVSWYNITGALGGSLLVILVNALLYQILAPSPLVASSSKLRLSLSNPPFQLSVILALVVIGILFSRNPKTELAANEDLRFAVVQPNVNPHQEDFLSQTEQLQNMRKLIALSLDHLERNVDVLLWPETAFEIGLREDKLHVNPAIREMRQAFVDFPNLHLITGILSTKFYEKGKKPTVSAKSLRSGAWYDVYNAALCLHLAKGESQIYRKNKLVPGAERVPYFKLLGFLESFAENLAGEGIGNYGTGKRQKNFSLGQQELVPLICYESIYGEFARSFVKDGAGILLVITNDGWWGKSSGKRQHLAYARLRCIESNRYLVRSANTGVSAVIDNRGKIIKQLGSWEEGGFVMDVPILQGQTVFVRYGNVLGRTASVLSVLLILILIVRRWSSRIPK